MLVNFKKEMVSELFVESSVKIVLSVSQSVTTSLFSFLSVGVALIIVSCFLENSALSPLSEQFVRMNNVDIMIKAFFIVDVQRLAGNGFGAGLVRYL